MVTNLYGRGQDASPVETAEATAIVGQTEPVTGYNRSPRGRSAYYGFIPFRSPVNRYLRCAWPVVG
jgi:hypothetical protein